MTEFSVRSHFNLAWPIALKMMMLHGILVIDAYLVSSLGEAALAAMGLAGAIAGLLLGVLFSFANAMQIRVAQAFGSGKPIALKTALGCGLLVNASLAIFGLAILLISSGKMVEFFAHTPWIAEAADTYLSIFLFVIFAEAISQCFTSFSNGCGNSRLPFYSYVISLPINVVISILLIHGLYGLPEMGLSGAAIGSAIAAILRLIFLAVGLRRKMTELLQVSGWLGGDLSAALKEHLNFSLPIAGTFVSMTMTNEVCMLIFARMSVNDFAAMTLIAPWIKVAGAFTMAWAQSTGILVAQLLGRKPSEAVLNGFLSRSWRLMFVAAGLVSLAYATVSLGAEWIYLDLQTETKAALLSFLPILLILPHPRSSNAICGQTLRAAGDTLYVMNIFVISQWLFRVPLTALFVLYLDLSVTWVFSIILLEELVKFPSFHMRFYSGKWKTGNILGAS